MQELPTWMECGIIVQDIVQNDQVIVNKHV